MVWFNAYMEPKRVSSVNGVIRGGGYLSGQDSFNRCGFRIGDYRRKDGKVWLGFRSEWCTQRWRT